MMSGRVRSILVGVVGFGLMACGSAGDESAPPNEADTASIQLELTTLTASGNTYRLGPASFDIFSVFTDVTLSVDASGDEPVLHVPVEPGEYEVTLHPDWVLQHVDADGVATPMRATLLSPAAQLVRVEPFFSAPVVYGFHLGESGIDLGIDVEEGVPPGFDGIIEPISGGFFSVTLLSGAGSCCFSSVSEAQQAFPDLNLFVSEP